MSTTPTPTSSKYGYVSMQSTDDKYRQIMADMTTLLTTTKPTRVSTRTLAKTKREFTTISPPPPPQQQQSRPNSALSEYAAHHTPTSTLTTSSSALLLPDLAESIAERSRERELRKSQRQTSAGGGGSAGGVTKACKDGKEVFTLMESERVQRLDIMSEESSAYDVLLRDKRGGNGFAQHAIIINDGIDLLEQRLRGISLLSKDVERRLAWRVVRDAVWEEDFYRQALLRDEITSFDGIVMEEEVERYAVTTHPCILFVLPSQRTGRIDLEEEETLDRADIHAMRLSDEERVCRLYVSCEEEAMLQAMLEVFEFQHAEVQNRCAVVQSWEDTLFAFVKELFDRMSVLIQCETWRTSNEEDRVRMYIISSHERELDSITCGKRTVKAAAEHSYASFMNDVMYVVDAESTTRIAVQRDIRREWQHLLECECHERVGLQRMLQERKRSAVEQAILEAQQYEMIHHTSLTTSSSTSVSSSQQQPVTGGGGASKQTRELLMPTGKQYNTTNTNNTTTVNGNGFRASRSSSRSKFVTAAKK